MVQGRGSELRQVLRVLARSPNFTLVAVLSLGLGIGANTAMFGVVRALLLTPLPVPEPRELALLGWSREGDFSISQIGSSSYRDHRDPDTGASWRSNFSYPLYQAMRDAAPGQAQVFAFAFLRGVSVAVDDRPASLAGGALADGRYFSTLRPAMALGRPLGETDDVPDAPVVAVVSHAFWMRAFGGDPAVVGATVRVNGTPTTVVGVTAAGFRGLSLGGFFPQTEITLPLAAQPRVYGRMSPDRSLFTADDVFWLRLMARVPEGAARASLEPALAAAMRSVASPLLAEDGHLPVVRLLPGQHGAQPVQGETARLLWVLLGVMGVVMLIACVNLASLMLARGVSRQREMAVRRALGSGRARLLRQSLLESLVLAAAGVAVGLALTALGRRYLSGILTGSLGAGAFGNVEMAVEMDPLVVALSAALGIAATLLFGLPPALRLSALDPVAWLKQRGAGQSTPRLTAGRGLIALQVAVSVPLVVGALLFLRTLANLGAVELGFDPRGIVEFQVDPGYTTLAEEEYPRLYQELLARVGAIPGVRSVTLMENALMSGITSNGTVSVGDARHMMYRNAVGPAFAETMGLPLVAGRLPGLQDDLDAPFVAAVNETAVREVFGGESPLGRILTTGGREVQVVGVVGDTPYRSRRDPIPPTLYEAALQRNGYGGHHLVLRSDLPLASLEPAVREAVRQVDPDVPVPELRSQLALMAQTGAREHVFTQTLAFFAAFALLLASIGLHGVTSYSVTRRTSEIGVRVAVGARPGQVLWFVLRQVLGLALVGTLVGVPASLAGGRLVASLLYGVAPTDGLSVAGAALVMLAVAVAAGMAPALRAARLDALVALRSE